MPLMANDLRFQPCLEACNWSLQSAKRKQPEPFHDAEVEEPIQQKRMRFPWNHDFHNMFMESIRSSGLSASSKNMPGLMNVPQTNYPNFSDQQPQDLASFMCMRCPGPSAFISSQEIWTCREEFNHAPSDNIMIEDANNENEYSGSNYVGNETGKVIFESVPFISYFDYNDEGNEMFCSKMLASYMDELLPFALIKEYGMLENITSGLIDFPKGAGMFVDNDAFILWLGTL